MAIGDLHNWYSAAGCEIEVGRTGQVSDQQDGLRYPAFYRVQDNQAAKGLWLGASNFFELRLDKEQGYIINFVQGDFEIVDYYLMSFH